MENLKRIRNRSIPRTTPRLVNILGINKANLQSKVSKEGAYVKECMHTKRMGEFTATQKREAMDKAKG